MDSYQMQQIKCFRYPSLLNICEGYYFFKIRRREASEMFQNTNSLRTPLLQRVLGTQLIGKHSFIYDSKNPKQISSKLVESKDLSICVLNIQAFNKDTNILRKTDEYEQNLWEDIKYIKPIVIIDEPQKIEGTKKKKSKSLVAIEELKPLFTLRYSATHKQLYNQIYKSDCQRREECNIER